MSELLTTADQRQLMLHAEELSQMNRQLKAERKVLYASHDEVLNAYLTAKNELIEYKYLRSDEIYWRDRKAKNRRQQLRQYQEKLEAMKTWSGILRTIGQKLGVCS